MEIQRWKGKGFWGRLMDRMDEDNVDSSRKWMKVQG